MLQKDIAKQIINIVQVIYDKNKPEKHIAYIDMNNLYGGAISEYLPYEGFKWIKSDNEIVNKILNKSDNS